MVKERFVETYSQGVTNVRKISNFNRVDNQGATAKSAAALSHNRRKGIFMTEYEAHQEHIRYT
ncbi:MAG: hypothetical protein ACLVG7_07305 [Negativibacillus sp.]